jgi:hypothetical protein
MLKNARDSASRIQNTETISKCFGYYCHEDYITSVNIVQNIYYWTELRQKDMAIGFELSGKAISCVADVPGSDFSQSSTRIYPIFDTCE